MPVVAASAFRVGIFLKLIINELESTVFQFTIFKGQSLVGWCVIIIGFFYFLNVHVFLKLDSYLCYLSFLFNLKALGKICKNHIFTLSYINKNDFNGHKAVFTLNV